MILKKLCLKNSLIEKNSFDKKLLNKKIYGKILVRSSFLSPSSCLLDDNFSTYNFPRLSLTNKKTFLNGRSFFYKNFIYSNKFNNYLRFQGLLSTNKTNFSFSNSFSKFLDILKNTNLKPSLFVLSPIKGGFECYSSGVIGFLPRSQFNLLLFKISYFFKKYKPNSGVSLTFINILITNVSSSLKKFSVLRTLFCWGKITLYSPYKKKNFVKTNKIRHFSKGLNFVFLANKSKEKINNIYGNKKKQKTFECFKIKN